MNAIKAPAQIRGNRAKHGGLGPFRVSPGPGGRHQRKRASGPFPATFRRVVYERSWIGPYEGLGGE